MKMKQSMAALIIGGFFGAGLAMAGMLNPAKVQGVLNITGQWDPSLMFVMIGGIGVAAIGFPLIRRRSGPILADSYSWPELVTLDRPLLLGSAILGGGLVVFVQGQLLRFSQSPFGRPHFSRPLCLPVCLLAKS